MQRLELLDLKKHSARCWPVMEAAVQRGCQFAPETVPVIGAPNGTSW